MLPPETRIGSVNLTVADLGAQQQFYERTLGLRELGRDGQTVSLGPDGGPAILELTGDPDAPRRPHGTTGLYHLAVLVPSRVDLGHALRRVIEAGWRFTGASDHLVSEALYLRDPEGNGIEIYRDRPRDEWARNDEGVIQMATLPLDLDGVLGEVDPAQPAPRLMSFGTQIGHVHLQVANIHDAEAFYAGGLGFDVTVRSYPGALFVSAGGYHHHIGLNIWESAGASPPPPGSTGLRSFEVVLPSAEDARRVADQARAAGAEVQAGEGATIALDPWRDAVLLTA
ncbi:MAG TPA: VOC family protein [Thermoleophilaceae bacterium]